MVEVVYLLRHAAPPECARARYWGRTDPGVDRDGLVPLAGMPSLLWPKAEKLLASPLPRTIETAAVLSHSLGLPVVRVPKLAEADFGFFEGLTFAEAAERFPEAVSEWGRLGDRFSFPGGESVAAFLERARQAWEDCLSLPDRTVLAVTHGGIIAAWCCLFLRISFSRRFAFRADYAALTAFVRGENGWDLVFFNNLA